MTVLAVGHDVVSLEAFALQLADVASGFVAATFTAEEQRTAAARGAGRVASLAVRFAAKEALIKAWSGARFGQPPAVAAVDLREIEVITDGWNRPRLRLHGAVADAVAALGEQTLDLQVSLSHDGDVASAVVLLQQQIRST